MPVRVAFHQSPALRPKTGVGHYTSELLAALRELSSDVAVTGLPDGMLEWAYRRAHPLMARMPRPAGPMSATAVPVTRSATKAIVQGGMRQAQRFFLWNLSRRLTARAFDLYHEPNFPILPTELPTVLTLYDLSLILTPQYHPADRIAKFEKQLPLALAQTTHVITISDVIREEIVRVLGVPPERVTRTYLGVRPQFAPIPAEQVAARLRQLDLPASYLLYVGTLEPRKNLLNLMRAYVALPAALRERCPLLLVGGWGWNIAEMAEYFRSHGKPNGVLHLGYVSEEDLATLYCGARALVYPSHYEGFGLPPLEMMACGGAVLASTAGALVELFGATAHLTAADDVDGWRTAMAQAISDDDWIAQLRRPALAAAAPFTWRRCAEETVAVYQRVVGQSVRAAA